MSRRKKMMGATCGGVLVAMVVAGCSSGDPQPQYAQLCQDQRPGPTQGNHVADSLCDNQTPGFKNVDVAIPDSPHHTEWIMDDDGDLQPNDYVDYNTGGTYIVPYGQRISPTSVIVVPANTSPGLIARGFSGNGGYVTRGGGLASYGPGARVTSLGGGGYAGFGSGSGGGSSFSGGPSGRASTSSVGSTSGSGTVSRGGLGVTGSSSGRGGSSGGDSAGS